MHRPRASCRRPTLFRRTRDRSHHPAGRGVQAVRQGTTHAQPQGGRGRRQGAGQAAAHPQGAGRGQRATKGESSQQVRQAMRNGDEKYLPRPRPGPGPALRPRLRRQPVRLHRAAHPAADGHDGARLLRQPAPSPALGNTVLFGTILLVIVDMLMLRFRLRRELAARFPDEPVKGDDLLRGHPRDADEVHATAQAAGEDRSGAPRALPLSRRGPSMTWLGVAVGLLSAAVFGVAAVVQAQAVRGVREHARRAARLRRPLGPRRPHDAGRRGVPRRLRAARRRDLAAAALPGPGAGGDVAPGDRARLAPGRGRAAAHRLARGRRRHARPRAAVARGRRPGRGPDDHRASWSRCGSASPPSGRPPSSAATWPAPSSGCSPVSGTPAPPSRCSGIGTPVDGVVVVAALAVPCVRPGGVLALLARHAPRGRPVDHGVADRGADVRAGGGRRRLPRRRRPRRAGGPR